jgi:Fe-S-cluster-containing dehydrogenase component
MAACPTRAIVKREEDGLVHVVRDLCVGCRACISACPWRVPQWDETSGKVIKCDLCQDRVASGLIPACVAGCTTHALSFSRANENVRKVRLLYAKSLLVDKEPG